MNAVRCPPPGRPTLPTDPIGQRRGSDLNPTFSPVAEILAGGQLPGIG